MAFGDIMRRIRARKKKARTYYYNAAGKKIKINPQRSSLMKKVMAHRKGKKLTAAHRKKISIAVKHTFKTGRTKHGRTVKRRRSGSRL